MASEPEEKKPKTTGRSPSYPYVDLESAIGLVRKVNEENRGHPTSREVAFEHMGMSAKSGPGRRTLAALKAFGLVEVKGDMMHLTPLAHQIIDDERPVSPERDQAIRTAAMNPPIHESLWAKYEASLPSDAQLRHHLVWNEGFNKASVGDFIDEYKRTLDFAKIGGSGKVHEEAEGAMTHSAAVGDLVQWQSQGVDQFTEPRRVRALQDRDGERWVFVDGSEAGIAASEVMVVKKPPKEETVAENQGKASPPIMPIPVERADTYLLTIPFKGKPLSVRVYLPGEELGSEHFKKVVAHLNLLIEEPEGKSN